MHSSLKSALISYACFLGPNECFLPCEDLLKHDVMVKLRPLIGCILTDLKTVVLDIQSSNHLILLYNFWLSVCENLLITLCSFWLCIEEICPKTLHIEEICPKTLHILIVYW